MLQVAFSLACAMPRSRRHGGLFLLQLCVVAETNQEAILAVHGKVAGAQVQILEQEGQRHLGQSLRLVLELDGVPFVDQAGLDLLRRWSGPCLVLRGGSPFLRALLAAEGLMVS